MFATLGGSLPTLPSPQDRKASGAAATDFDGLVRAAREEGVF